MASLRIPIEPQNLFIASGQGKEVPPPQVLGRGRFLSFTRRWIGSSSGVKTKGSTKTRTAPKAAPSIGTIDGASRSSRPCNDTQRSSIPKQSSMRSSPSKQLSGKMERQSSGRSQNNSKNKARACDLSPVDYLESVMRSRGYETSIYQAQETGFFNKPTRLQLASYQGYLLGAVESPTLLRELLQVGLSPNPCNKEGESLLHAVCRRGKVEALKVMVECGCRLQVCDSIGRTPLRDACWSAVPNFEVVELILEHSEEGHGHLFRMADRYGLTPLHYVCRANWGAWDQFIATHIDNYWPRDHHYGDTPVVEKMPNTMPLEDPSNALTPFLAEKLASGRLTLGNVMFFMNCGDESDMSDDSSLSGSSGPWSDSSDHDDMYSPRTSITWMFTAQAETELSKGQLSSNTTSLRCCLSRPNKRRGRATSGPIKTEESTSSSWGDVSKELRLQEQH